MPTDARFASDMARPHHPGIGAARGVARFLSSPRGSPLLDLATRCVYNDTLRGPMLRAAKQWAISALSSDSAPRSWQRIERERALMAVAMLETVDRLIGQRFLSRSLVRRVMQLWGQALAVLPEKQPACVRFMQENGCRPPWFIVIAPGRACNQHCPGCYADANSGSPVLPWDVLDRVISEARELWGVPLIVLSGGEPLLYRSEGRDVLDAVEKHSDCMFLMFTNGTLIDRDVARRMARLANLTPAISVEGLRADTDARRGEGAFDRVLQAIQNLREVGLPFGISATATQLNCDRIIPTGSLTFSAWSRAPCTSSFFTTRRSAAARRWI